MRLAREKPRRGTTPVVATMVLIVVTLVAAAALAGFVFAWMVASTEVALVSAEGTTCAGIPEVCSIPLQNTGSGNVAISGVCAMSIGGSLSPGVASLKSGDLKGGGSAVVECTVAHYLHVATDSSITGWVDLQNGAEVLFYGKAS